MYERYFGLTTSPFTMSPDPRFLYLTPCHREALAGLTYGILSRKGFVVVIGEAGTGKTSLLRRVLQAVKANKSFIFNPSTTPEEFLELAMRNFGFDEIPHSKSAQLSHFEAFLRRSQDEDRISVLVVDEAQRLSPSVLEEIRLLTNLESSRGKLLQIVLAGQSELRGLLNRPDLRQLKQRIATRLILNPLSGPVEVGEYVRHRWTIAGGSGAPPFTPDALAGLARYASGIPRIVNALCDNALVSAFADGVLTVSEDRIRAAAADLDWLDQPQSVVAAPAVPSNGFPKGIEARSSTRTTATNGANVSAIPTLQRYDAPRQNRSWIGRLMSRKVNEVQ